MSALDGLHGYEVHPAANIFPLIEGPEFESFCADIAANGQMEPVVIDAATGLLIDGRNRVRACNTLGIVVEATSYEGADVMQFVVSHNLHRRHLTDSQRAMVAGKMANRTAGYRDSIVQMGDITHLNPNRAEVSKLLNVTPVAITKAKQVIRDGTPAVQALVESGKAPVTTAARVATTFSPEDQDEYAERVNNGMDPVAAAPPDIKAQERRAANPPEAPKRKANQHVSMLDSIADTMRVWSEHSLKTITELDSSVTTEEATRLTDDLSTSIAALRRINNLLKERTK